MQTLMENYKIISEERLAFYNENRNHRKMPKFCVEQFKFSDDKKQKSFEKNQSLNNRHD